MTESLLFIKLKPREYSFFEKKKGGGEHNKNLKLGNRKKHKMKTSNSKQLWKPFKVLYLLQASWLNRL